MDSDTRESIHVLGASTVLGDALRKTGDSDWARHTLPGILGEELPEMRVWNLGFNGALPADQYRMAQLTRRYRPRLAILSANVRQFSGDGEDPQQSLSRPWLASFRVDVAGRPYSLGTAGGPWSHAEEFLWCRIARVFPPLRDRDSLLLTCLGNSPLIFAQERFHQALDAPTVEDRAIEAAILKEKQKKRFESVKIDAETYQMGCFRATIAEYCASGIPVIFYYSQDRLETLHALVQEDAYRKQVAELERLASDAGAKVVATSALSPDTEFLDATHLTQTGNRRLAAKLVPTIHALLGCAPEPAKSLPKPKPVLGGNEIPDKPIQLMSLLYIMLFVVCFVGCQLSHSHAFRNGLYILCSLIFLGSYLGSWTTALVGAAYLLLGYLLPVSLFHGLLPRRRWILAAGIVVHVTFMVFLNRYAWLGDPAWLSGLVRLIGVSYIFFRAVHLWVDAYFGDLNRIDILVYLSFMCGFLTLLAGPIAQYKRSEEAWAEGVATKVADPLAALTRIAWGAFQKFVLAAFLAEAITLPLALNEVSPARLAVYFYGYAFYALFDFGGYCHMVIGMGALVGLNIPENFKWPFLARNAQELWGRWHITFCDWLKVYVFNPLAKFMLAQGRRFTSLKIGMAYMTAFALAGIWHGTLSITIWGVITGAVLLYLKLQEQALMWWWGKAGLKKYQSSTFCRVAATVITFHFTCYSFSLCPLDSGVLWQYHKLIFRSLGII